VFDSASQIYILICKMYIEMLIHCSSSKYVCTNFENLRKI